MLSLTESILKSNTAGLDWLSNKYDNFTLFTIGYIEDDRSVTPGKETLNDFFDVDKVIKYKGPFLKTYNSVPQSPSDYVEENKKFFQSIGNILYNCKLDDNELNKKLKDFLKPNVKIFTEELGMRSGNSYFYYTFVKDKTKELDFGYKCTK